VRHSYTALHWAASSGDTEIVQLLLSARCNINATSTDGNTPLHSAALGNNVEIMQALIREDFFRGIMWEEYITHVCEKDQYITKRDLQK